MSYKYGSFSTCFKFSGHIWQTVQLWILMSINFFTFEKKKIPIIAQILSWCTLYNVNIFVNVQCLQCHTLPSLFDIYSKFHPWLYFFYSFRLFFFVHFLFLIPASFTSLPPHSFTVKNCTRTKVWCVDSTAVNPVSDPCES